MARIKIIPPMIKRTGTIEKKNTPNRGYFSGRSE
jgi:hypothetical protein